ncbi:Protein of unknown function [Cohaesibacter sp. ES.047]|uniref:DUF2848 domain-containing protein n=1 Tax=Cohaesibacter sp. ES.047 TaxID=1798205 RepID=UPI000BB8F065|nr:DUF2848 domain-containing protein [Cohaesibacter sp. ES.047]SNY91319.1 Protein of unknown function [Cohaesibacter sp. ES.047]
MKFTCLGNDLDLDISHVVVAGWTGRDTSAVQHHIDELSALGVSPPSTIPLYYRVSATTLTQSTTIEVLGHETSGEVEPLLIKDGESFYIGLGSDHTDRKIEAASVAASKQICPKPVATELWPYEDVADHLDSLVLRCFIMEKGEWTLYQQGEVKAIRPITELIKGARLPSNSAMLCGTLGAIGGVRPASQYKLELEDPILSRSITLSYELKTLPEIS